MHKLSVLIVDDEVQALKYFQKSFANDFQIHTASGVDEALGIVAEHGRDIGVVITDQRMPAKTGVDLLNQLRTEYPSIVRVLTTAYSDLDSAIEAVNSGAIYKYVVKPWNLKDLRGTVLRALDFAQVQAERDQLLKEKIGVLHQMMVADRIRSFAFLAAGISNRIRNSMSALKEFVDQSPLQAREIDATFLKDNPDYWGDIWQLAREETEQILTLIDRVSETIAEPSYSFSNQVVIGHLVEQALNEPPALRVTSDQLTVEVDGDLPHLKIDEALISKMVRQLAEAVADLGGPHSSVVVGLDTASDGSGDEVRITISGEGPAWSDDVVGELFNPFPSRSPTRPDGQLDRQLGLLSAFFIAHHHGGSLQVHPSAPHGPGFEVRLPVSAPTVEPANRVDLIERILLRYESVAGLGA